MRIRTLHAKAVRVPDSQARLHMAQFDSATHDIQHFWMEVPCFGRLRNREHQYQRLEISRGQAWTLVRGGWEYTIDNAYKVDASCTVTLHEH